MTEDVKRILIYLADPIVLDVTAFRLQLLGLDVVKIQDDDKMAMEVGGALPSLIIVDLDLENGAGLRWIERIASDECLNHVPIVCMSREGDLQEAEHAFNAGAHEYLIVPYDPVQLQDKIDRALEFARKREQEGSLRAAVPTA